MEIEVATQTVEERISQDLAPFDAVAAKIAAIKEEYRGLKINGPDDKDGFKIVHAAWQTVRDIRLDAEKLHTTLKADALKFGKACDERLRTIKEGLKPMEDDFYAQWKAEEGRKEREKQEARLAEERALKARSAERKGAVDLLGFGLFGIEYRHTLPGVDPINELWVLDKSDEEFEAILTTAAQQVASARDTAAKAEQALKEQQLKEKEVAEANEKLAKELKAKEDEINAKVTSARVDALKARGMVEQCEPVDFIVLRLGRMTINASDLHELGTGGFDNLLQDVEEEKKRVDAHNEKEARRDRRSHLLREAGASFDKSAGSWHTPNRSCYWESVGDWNDEQFASQLEEFKADIAATAAKAEADRIANDQRIREEAAQAERDRAAREEQERKDRDAEALKKAGDIGVINALLEDLGITHDASLKYQNEAQSAIAKHGLAKAREHMHNAMAVLNGTLKDLK